MVSFFVYLKQNESVMMSKLHGFILLYPLCLILAKFIPKFRKFDYFWVRSLSIFSIFFKFFLHGNLKSIFKYQNPKEKNFKEIHGIEQYSTDAKLAELMHFCINYAEIKRKGHQTTIIRHVEIIRRLVLCEIMKILHSNIAKIFRNIFMTC